MKMICPECEGEMEVFWRGIFIRRSCYGKCKICKYTCSADFVSGFWSGATRAMEKVKDNIDWSEGREETLTAI